LTTVPEVYFTPREESSEKLLVTCLELSKKENLSQEEVNKLEMLKSYFIRLLDKDKSERIPRGGRWI
jgi:hypothetical protein